jgi:hypothetical protein
MLSLPTLEEIDQAKSLLASLPEKLDPVILSLNLQSVPGTAKGLRAAAARFSQILPSIMFQEGEEQQATLLAALGVVYANGVVLGMAIAEVRGLPALATEQEVNHGHL